MNKLISIINEILYNQRMSWLFGTLIGASCIAIYGGLKIGALVLGIWILLTIMVRYWDSTKD